MSEAWRAQTYMYQWESRGVLLKIALKNSRLRFSFSKFQLSEELSLSEHTFSAISEQCCMFREWKTRDWPGSLVQYIFLVYVRFFKFASWSRYNSGCYSWHSYVRFWTDIVPHSISVSVSHLRSTSLCALYVGAPGWSKTHKKDALQIHHNFHLGVCVFMTPRSRSGRWQLRLA
jgi:hypothetical protein